MPFDPDDTRLTAFALGELDEADRAAVEAEIADCAESRKYIEEVRETARLLTEQLHREPAPGLTDEHRQAIEVGLEPAAAVLPLTRRFRWAPILGFAVAAGILGVAVTVTLSRWAVKPSKVYALNRSDAWTEQTSNANKSTLLARLSEKESRAASNRLADKARWGMPGQPPRLEEDMKREKRDRVPILDNLTDAAPAHVAGESKPGQAPAAPAPSTPYGMMGGRASNGPGSSASGVGGGVPSRPVVDNNVRDYAYGRGDKVATVGTSVGGIGAYTNDLGKTVQSGNAGTVAAGTTGQGSGGGGQAEQFGSKTSNLATRSRSETLFAKPGQLGDLAQGEGQKGQRGVDPAQPAQKDGKPADLTLSYRFQAGQSSTGLGVDARTSDRSREEGRRSGELPVLQQGGPQGQQQRGPQGQQQGAQQNGQQGQQAQPTQAQRQLALSATAVSNRLNRRIPGSQPVPDQIAESKKAEAGQSLGRQAQDAQKRPDHYAEGLVSERTHYDLNLAERPADSIGAPAGGPSAPVSGPAAGAKPAGAASAPASASLAKAKGMAVKDGEPVVALQDVDRAHIADHEIQLDGIKFAQSFKSKDVIREQSKKNAAVDQKNAPLSAPAPAAAGRRRRFARARQVNG